MLIRIYDKDEMNEVFRRTEEGGILYFIERTDTNEFAYSESRPNSGMSNHPDFGMSDTRWTNDVSFFKMGTGMFLTKEAAEKCNGIFHEDGCPFCGNGSKEIPTIVTEHEFVRKEEKI